MRLTSVARQPKFVLTSTPFPFLILLTVRVIPYYNFYTICGIMLDFTQIVQYNLLHKTCNKESNTMEEQKTCKNCRFFLQHYVNGKTSCSYFMPVNCGHCICRDLTKKERNRVSKVTDCRCWEPVEILKAERIQTIEAVLRSMEKHLKQIAFILKEDYGK